MIALAVLAPFAGAALAALLGRKLQRWTAIILVLALLPAVSLALRAPGAAAGETWRETWPWLPQLGLNVTFGLDGFSLLLAVLVAVMGIVTGTYAGAYLGKYENIPRFFTYLLLFAGSMLGLVLAENLVLLFVFWELTSVTSFLLIGYWHWRGAAQDGAVKALTITAGGGLALLAATAMIAVAGSGTNLMDLDVAALQASVWFYPAMILVLLAAFTKSAQVPFHLWLPTAMEAPTPVSAFLHSATMVKAGVILIAKLGLVFASPTWTTVTLTVGLATLVWGAAQALRQTDLKALLAFSTVSQLGLLVALYGINEPAARFAGTLHLLNHAMFKAALFLVVGIIDHNAHTRNLPELGGLRRIMPVTFVIALIGALSMAGLPPLGGFISKELFYEELLHIGWGVAVIGALGSAFTLAYSFKLLTVFFGPLRAPKPEELHEAGPGLWVPAVPLVLAALAFGLLPFTAEALTRVAGPALEYADLYKSLYLWHGITPALLLSLGTWAVGAALFFGRDGVVRFMDRLTPAWNANTVYYAIVHALEDFAEWFTQGTQGRHLPNQLRIVLSAIALLVGYGLWRSGTLTQLPVDAPAVPLAAIPVSALLLAGAIGVLFARDAVTAIVLTGLTGFGTAAAFLVLRAPDLALTQLLIEAITVILFLLVFRLLPPMRHFGRRPLRGVWDVALAGATGLGVFAFMMSTAQPLAERISPYFLKNAYKEAGGTNVVNVILVDFRAFDTLGEIVVLLVVALGVYSLINLRARP